MDMSVDEAIDATVGLKKVQTRLQTLHDLGLGYLTLGEPTPALSGGEAQRLKLASEMGRVQDDAVFVFDEPTIGLHPLDVLQVLLNVFDGLVAKGATVIVIEHDLDLIRNADYVIDMGPGVATRAGNRLRRTPADIACPKALPDATIEKSKAALCLFDTIRALSREIVAKEWQFKCDEPSSSFPMMPASIIRRR
ncbi:MAG: hypothetical protein ACLU37_04240 [Collinsella sp.]